MVTKSRTRLNWWRIRSAVYLDIINRAKGVKVLFFLLYYNYSFSISLGCLKIKNIQRGRRKYCHLLKPQVLITEFTPNRNEPTPFCSFPDSQFWLLVFSPKHFPKAENLRLIPNVFFSLSPTSNLYLFSETSLNLNPSLHPNGHNPYSLSLTSPTSLSASNLSPLQPWVAIILLNGMFHVIPLLRDMSGLHICMF